MEGRPPGRPSTRLPEEPIVGPIVSSIEWMEALRKSASGAGVTVEQADRLGWGALADLRQRFGAGGGRQERD